MSAVEPLAVAALLRELVRKEITLALLDAEAIKLDCRNLDGGLNLGNINRAILRLERDCSDLTIKLVHEAEKS
jgi:hypothetical protein